MDWTEEQWRNTSAPPGGEEHCFVYDVNYSELEPGQIIPSGETTSGYNINLEPNLDFKKSLIHLHLVLTSDWQKSQVHQYFGWCTADL